MLFKEARELQQIFPTSDIKKIDAYLLGLCDEEINSLLPLVGEELLVRLNEDYAELSDESAAQLVSASGTTDRRLTILRTAQKVCAYAYFANNMPLMSVRLNVAGGANVAYTDGYDAPDDKQNVRLDKALWHQTLRAKEQLLHHLEADARAGRVYTELWKKSDYFYRHSNLLFTTAAELHPHYLDLGPTPLLSFIGSIHVQELCTSYYIVGTIGQQLLQALIDRKYNLAETAAEDAEEEQPSEEETPREEPEEPEEGDSEEPEEEEKEEEGEEEEGEETADPATPQPASLTEGDEGAAEEGSEAGQSRPHLKPHRPHQPAPVDKAAWHRLDHLVRTALATFMKYELSDKKNEHVRNLAQTQLTLAESFIKDNPGQFAAYSPHLKPHRPQQDRQPQWQHPHRTSGHERERRPLPNSRPGDVVFNML